MPDFREIRQNGLSEERASTIKAVFAAMTPIIDCLSSILHDTNGMFLKQGEQTTMEIRATDCLVKARIILQVEREGACSRCSQMRDTVHSLYQEVVEVENSSKDAILRLVEELFQSGSNEQEEWEREFRHDH